MRCPECKEREKVRTYLQAKDSKKTVCTCGKCGHRWIVQTPKREE